MYCLRASGGFGAGVPWGSPPAPPHRWRVLGADPPSPGSSRKAVQTPMRPLARQTCPRPAHRALLDAAAVLSAAPAERAWDSNTPPTRTADVSLPSLLTAPSRTKGTGRRPRRPPAPRAGRSRPRPGADRGEGAARCPLCPRARSRAASAAGSGSARRRLALGDARPQARSWLLGLTLPGVLLCVAPSHSADPSLLPVAPLRVFPLKRVKCSPSLWCICCRDRLHSKRSEYQKRVLVDGALRYR